MDVLRQSKLELVLEKITASVPQITSNQAYQKHALYIDIREQHELSSGIITNAKIISRGFLEIELLQSKYEKYETIIIYCESGLRSILAVQTLRNLGLNNVFSLSGGIAGWKNEKLPISKHQSLDKLEEIRYKRHINLDLIGESGQIQLKKGKVLVVGCGGLGTPCLQYLAAAGVGTIGIVDNDVVDITNLQRQILFNEACVNHSKVEVAKQTLKNFNSHIQINAYPEFLSQENVEQLFLSYDIIIDCTDNFKSRYLINTYCLKMNKPLVHGSVFEFYGNLAVFNYKGSACYQCVFPEPPPIELLPNCNQTGVLGTVPGVIGVLQANEAVKIILSTDVMTNQLLHFNFLTLDSKKLTFSKGRNCVCHAL